MKTCSKCGEMKAVEMFYTKSAACKACAKARMKDYHVKNCETERERKRAYYKANREVVLAKAKTFYMANPEAKKARTSARYHADPEAARAWAKTYRAENTNVVNAREAQLRREQPQVFRAKLAKHRSSKLQRTPRWLSFEHHEQIKAVYAESVRLTETTGIEHHVDHIVPLQGKTVSGLHVPWNLRAIPALDNVSKGNRYDGPDSWAA